MESLFRTVNTRVSSHVCVINEALLYDFIRDTGPKQVIFQQLHGVWHLILFSHLRNNKPVCHGHPSVGLMVTSIREMANMWPSQTEKYKRGSENALELRLFITIICSSRNRHVRVSLCGHDKMLNLDVFENESLK